MSYTGTLYLIPTNLSSAPMEHVIPSYNLSVVQSLSYFFVENRKSARHFLKACGVPTPFDNIEFRLLNKQTSLTEEFEILEPLFNGHDMGLLSEAGLPGIADPGSELVNVCHQNGISVKPLTGPSSIYLALMGSGLNGQSFTFHGYLPVKSNERQKQLKDLD